MKEVFIVNFLQLASPLKRHGLRTLCFNSEVKAITEVNNRQINSEKLPIAIVYHPQGPLNNALMLLKVPVIVLSDQQNPQLKEMARKAGAIDYYEENLNAETISMRIKGIQSRETKKIQSPKLIQTQIPLGKRVFDIMISSLLILILSPLFVIVSLLIKTESRGPVFYSLPRVGTGYRIFPFFKFRSMKVGADQMLKSVQHLNHYQPVRKTRRTPTNIKEGPILVGDDQMIPEVEYANKLKSDNQQTFMKIKNDPRITRVGHWIRKTSIDELPQLFNVLMGHMSIVGNRPLPLYEAEKLTSDDWAIRFMAPAGITGLWQVTERGKSHTTEESRKKLDAYYAKKYSMWMDLKILIKTPLALFQQEDV